MIVYVLVSVVFLIVMLGLCVVISHLVNIAAKGIDRCIAKYNERKLKFNEELKYLCKYGDINQLEALLKKGLNPNTIVVTKERYTNDFSYCNEYSPFEHEDYFYGSLLELCKDDEKKCALLRKYGATA